MYIRTFSVEEKSFVLQRERQGLKLLESGDSIMDSWSRGEGVREMGDIMYSLNFQMSSGNTRNLFRKKELGSLGENLRVFRAVEAVFVDIVDDLVWNEVLDGLRSPQRSPNLRRADIVLDPFRYYYYVPLQNKKATGQIDEYLVETGVLTISLVSKSDSYINCNGLLWSLVTTTNPC